MNNTKVYLYDFRCEASIEVIENLGNDVHYVETTDCTSNNREYDIYEGQDGVMYAVVS